MNTFATITADPPWAERGGGKVKRGADRHYPLMRTPDIIATMLQAPVWRPAPDAHLYLWVTDNFLEDGLLVARALGFTYKRTFAWIKGEDDDEQVTLQLGLGKYARGSHELCLFCTRGDGMAVSTQAKDVRSVIVGRRGRHSEKPQEFYDLVERRSRGPFLEIFARSQRAGWTSWGNEVPVIGEERVA